MLKARVLRAAPTVWSRRSLTTVLRMLSLGSTSLLSRASRSSSFSSLAAAEAMASLVGETW